MKYIITRIDYNHVKAEVEGYYPLKGSYDDFFNELKGYLHRPNYVKSVSYNNHTITIEKLEPGFGFLYKDTYVLDGLLESDARFIEGLNSFLNEYEERKDTLNNNALNAREEMAESSRVLNKATHLYIKYCEDSEIEVIEDKELARKVIDLFKAGDSRIYTGLTCTLEGDTYTYPKYKFDTPRIQRLKLATGASGVATGVLAATSLLISNPIPLIAGVATGVGCYCANKKKKEVNDEEAKKTLRELAEIYGKLYPEVTNDEPSPKLQKVNK